MLDPPPIWTTANLSKTHCPFYHLMQLSIIVAGTGSAN
ncbi:unnamed protein product [Rhodiola kirilowii]